MKSYSSVHFIILDLRSSPSIISELDLWLGYSTSIGSDLGKVHSDLTLFKALEPTLPMCIGSRNPSINQIKFN